MPSSRLRMFGRSEKVSTVVLEVRGGGDMTKRKTTATIPDASLRQHIAVVGETGSGKTYTAKGID